MATLPPRMRKTKPEATIITSRMTTCFRPKEYAIVIIKYMTTINKNFHPKMIEIKIPTKIKAIANIIA